MESGTEAIRTGALDEAGEIQVWLASGKFPRWNRMLGYLETTQLHVIFILTFNYEKHP